MNHESTFGEADEAADGQGDAPEPSRRRLGLRIAVSCWALLQARGRSLYAQVVELSSTGVVLRLAGVDHAVRFRDDQRFGLDLFVPGSPSPVHAIVRPVRAIGVLEAFELVEVSSVDRLTLAEYLDRHRPRPPLPVPGPARKSARGAFAPRV
jgi:hypothetical protein